MEFNNLQEYMDTVFFVEDVFNGQYKNDRKRFTKDLNTVMEKLCERIKKECTVLTKKAVQEEVMKSIETNIETIKDDVIVSKLETMFKQKEGDQIEVEKDDIIFN